MESSGGFPTLPVVGLSLLGLTLFGGISHALPPKAEVGRGRKRGTEFEARFDFLPPDSL